MSDNTSFPSHIEVVIGSIDDKEYSEAEKNSEDFLRHIQLIELLSKALGFNYELGPFVAPYEGDILAGDYILDEDYFLQAFYPNKVSDVTFATTKPDYTSNNLTFLNPFSADVWLLCLLSAIFMTLALFSIFRGSLPLLSVLFYTLMTFLGIHRNWKPKSKAQSLMVLTWSVGMTFLTLCYGSVLLSCITLPSRERGITNFNELYEAIVKGKAKAFQFEGYGTGNILLKSADEKLLFIGRHIRHQKGVLKGKEGNFLEVMNPNIAVVGPRDTLEALYGDDTHFISKDSTSLTLSTFYDWKPGGLCCKKKVNRIIHRIWQRV